MDWEKVPVRRNSDCENNVSFFKANNDQSRHSCVVDLRDFVLCLYDTVYATEAQMAELLAMDQKPLGPDCEEFMANAP